MLYFTIVFLCMAGLFLALLEDRFRVWVTLSITAGTYLLSLGAVFVLRRLFRGPASSEQVSCAVGCLLFFLMSLPLFRNNGLQKLFVALLCLCNFTFLEFFIPLLLGVLPFSASGGPAGVISVLLTCLFALLTGLCLYHPFRHYSDRGISGFMVGMLLTLVLLYVLCLGRLDFLFRINIPAARLLCAVLLYCAIIFSFRSMYQAGRFREKTAFSDARDRMMDMKARDLNDTLAAVREARAAQKHGEYALDTVQIMLADGYTEKIPAYIGIAKANAAKNPILERYHENPYLDAVIASKAAFAAQNNISFECNAVTEGSPLTITELCLVVDEMLTRACRDAALFEGRRKLRFTVFPAEGSLAFEAVYSGHLPQQKKNDWTKKKFADLLNWLFDDSPREPEELQGLENTEEIISRYSGKLSVSGTPGDVILRAALHF